jgi:hypothetical protein
MYIGWIDSIVDEEPRDAFITALECGDTVAMRKWAKPLLESINVGRPRLFVSDLKTVQAWEARSLAFLEEGRRHGW